MSFKRISHAALEEPIRTRDATIFLYRALKVAGLIIPMENRKIYILWIFVLTFLTMIFLPLNFVVKYLWITNEINPIEFITSVQVGLNALGLAIKLNILRFQINRLDKANLLMDYLDGRCTTKDEALKIRKFVAFGNGLYLTYLAIYMCYASIGFVNTFFNNRPPYNIYIPYLEWQNSRKLLYLQACVESLLVGFACFQATIVDIYPIIYVESLRHHLKILNERIKNLSGKKGNSEKRKIMLKNCIKDHKTLLNYYKIISSVISGTICTQFLICGTVIGIAIIILSLINDFSTRLRTIIYLFAVLLQTFPLCYFCNCLIDDSMGLSVTLFHSDWFKQDLSYKKTVLYFMHKLQKPMIFYAMNVFTITLETNMKVAKFAFTVYTLSQQMNLAEKLTK